ncbi:MAG: MoaD/ThiS family protein [Nitrospirales bacterium]
MTVTVRLFGMLRTLAENQPEIVVAVNGRHQVNDLIEALQTLYPEVGELLLKKNVLVSVNHEIAHGETEISSADEIAFLPPFAGGADGEWRGGPHVHG